MRVRLLDPADIPSARRLWHICFPEDSEAFLDWFFTQRCMPSLSGGCFEGESLLSVMHGTVMPLACNGKTVPALMVSGVATEPGERGKGHMHRTMLFLREIAAEQGIHVLFNHPQDPDGYKRLGFLPCTDTLYFDQPRTFFLSDGKTGLRQEPFSLEKALLVYQKLTGRYSAFSVRDEAAFELRARELTLDGGEAYLFCDAHGPSAYCFCHREGSVTVCDEILSLGDYAPVLSELCRLTGCERIHAKLPPETPLPGERRVQNIMLADAATYASFGYGTRLCYSVDEY